MDTNRLEEIRNYLNRSIGEAPRGVIEYIYRLETANEDLRRRNGDLVAALDNLDAAPHLKPLDGRNSETGPFNTIYDNFPTRYVVLDRMITMATEVARSIKDNDELMQIEATKQLVESVNHFENYWEYAAIEREERSKNAQKRWEKRRENDLSRSA